MFIDVTVNLINLKNPPKLLKHKMLTFFSLNITVMDKDTEFGHTDNTWLHTRARKYNVSALGTYFGCEGVKRTYLDLA